MQYDSGQGNAAPSQQMAGQASPRMLPANGNSNAFIQGASPDLIQQLLQHVQQAQQRMQPPQSPEDLANHMSMGNPYIQDSAARVMAKRKAQRHSFLAPAVQRQMHSRQVLQQALMGQLAQHMTEQAGPPQAEY